MQSKNICIVKKSHNYRPLSSSLLITIAGFASCQVTKLYVLSGHQMHLPKLVYRDQTIMSQNGRSCKQISLLFKKRRKPGAGRIHSFCHFDGACPFVVIVLFGFRAAVPLRLLLAPLLL